MLKERFNTLKNLLLEETRGFYGDRLVTLAVFGSAARETQSYTSDLDFIIVAEDLPDGRMKRVAEFEEVEKKLEPLIHSFGAEGIHTRLSPVFKSPEEVVGGSPLFIDMVEDLSMLHDRNGFFENRISVLRKRLAALGARRIWKGNAWYWDLKPDYKPGEVFEL